MNSLRPHPHRSALLLVLLAALPASAQPSDSHAAIQFFGTGALLSDRVTIQIDDNAPGSDASTPADIGAGSFTIEFWVRGDLADNPAAAQAPGSHPSNLWINGNIVVDRDIWAADPGHPDAHRDFGISFANGRVQFGTGSNGAALHPDGEHTLVGSRNVLDGAWRHVACVRDVADGSKTIYVDGELDATGAAVSDDDLSYPDGGVPIDPSSNCDCNHVLVLGAEKHDAGPEFPSFNGFLDEFRLWKSALPQECLARYRHRTFLNPAPGRGPVDGFPGLVAAFRFEEGSGTTTADSSGATTNGRINQLGIVVDGTPGHAEWTASSDDPAHTAPVWNGTDIGGPLTSRVVVSGLTRPLFVCAAPGDPDRLFIVEQRDDAAVGRIRIFRKSTGQLHANDYLTLSGVNTGNEEGLLGMAFHPDYEANGFVYVYFSDTANGSRSFLRRYTASHLHPGGLDDPGRLDPASAFPVLDFPQPQSNHNGGWLGFREGDPGHYLYLSTGDGGGGDDNDTGHTADSGNAQDIEDNLLGKILRLDVDGDDFPADPNRNYAIPPTNRFVGTDGDDEIWLYGLRNPWRCSFDRATGDFWIADVGQNNREEINFRAASTPDTAPGNYGWRYREGFLATPTGGVGAAKPADNVDPILDYVRTSGSTTDVLAGDLFGTSITGGYVYRGPLAGLQGLYFFADARANRLWSMRYCGGVTELTDRTAELVPANIGSGLEITSFGEDHEGNLYYTSRNGRLVEIVIADPWHAWRNASFPAAQLADDAVSGPAGNPDHDPRGNLAEFFVNSDPHDSDPPLPAELGTTNLGPDQFFTLSFDRHPQSFGVLDVTGQTTGDLTGYDAITPEQILTDSETRFEFRDSVPMSSAPFRAGRLRLDLPQP